jgi:hypothetical protein
LSPFTKFDKPEVRPVADAHWGSQFLINAQVFAGLQDRDKLNFVALSTRPAETMFLD